MFKCPNEQFEVFDLKTTQCQFKCKAKGSFQNPDNCEEYYYCSSANAQPLKSKCPKNWVFDGIGCNVNPEECKHAPPTSTTPIPNNPSNPTDPDGLSEAKNVDQDEDIVDYFKTFESDIIHEICNIPQQAPDCNDNPENHEVVPMKYKTKSDGDDTIYFVRLDLIVYTF